MLPGKLRGPMNKNVAKGHLLLDRDTAKLPPLPAFLFILPLFRQEVLRLDAQRAASYWPPNIASSCIPCRENVYNWQTVCTVDGDSLYRLPHCFLTVGLWLY